MTPITDWKNSSLITATTIVSMVVLGSQGELFNEPFYSKINELQPKIDLNKENYFPADYNFAAEYEIFTENRKIELLINLSESLLEGMESLPPEISRDIDEHFWELF